MINRANTVRPSSVAVRLCHHAVAVGNQIYDSVNNLTGHYQDNRVQYFLGYNNASHLAQYVSAGIIGLLFGPGGESQQAEAPASTRNR